MALLPPRTPRYTASVRLGQIGRVYADLRPALLRGRAISNIGKAFVGWGEKLKDQRDAAVVGELYNSWRDEDRQVLAELGSKKGRDAVNLGQQYDDYFERAIADVDSQAENGTQQRALRNHLTRKREQNLDALARYEAQEGQRFRKEQETAFVDNAISDAREHEFDDVALENTIIDTLEYVTNANPGMSQEALESLHNNVMGKILYSNLKAQIDIDPARAIRNIEGWKEKLGESYKGLIDEARTESKQHAIDSMQTYLQNRYEKGGDVDFAAMRRELRNNKFLPKDIKFEARQWIDAYQAQHTAATNIMNKQLHDNEDRAIAMMFVEGQYADAKEAIRKSQYLSADEIMRYNNALRSIEKEGGVIDPTKAAAQIVRLNRMMRTGVEPNTIIIEAAVSPYLTKEDKEQYINKVETKIRSDIDTNRRRAYEIIENRIKPQRGENTIGGLLETPLETIRVEEGQRAFDDWLDSQIKVDQIPTRNEMLDKAEEIGLSKQPTVAEQLESLAREQELQESILEQVRELRR